MDAVAAQVTLDTIAAGAALTWLAGAWFVWRQGARLSEPVEGVADLQGDPVELAARAAAAMAQGTNPLLQQVRIESAERESIAWSSDLALRHRGELRFARAGAGRSRAEWRLTFEHGGGWVSAARWVLVVGAVIVIALYLLLRNLAVLTEEPGTRGQVWQMVQSVHLLWPPFLLAWLPLMIKRRMAAACATLVGNLQYAPR